MAALRPLADTEGNSLQLPLLDMRWVYVAVG